jgi:two-component system LytT family sensor kinase
MSWHWRGSDRKYFYIEAVFFITLFCFRPILSNFEYNFIELRKVSIVRAELISSLYYSVFDVFTAVIYYRIVQRFLFRKKYYYFILATIAYLIIYHFYRSGLYYVTGHLPFLPESLQKSSMKWFNAHSRVNFSTTALAYFIRSMRQEEQMRALREHQLTTELNYLKAQLHPHFFFNTINNIYSLALKGSAETAPMVAKLGEMMRYILYEADQKTVLLNREIDFLNNYVSIERIRHKHHRIRFDIQGIDQGIYIEPLLLLPFIENAFKHGLSQETKAGDVGIVLCINERELILEVANSKPSINALNVTGIGLKNVLKRLDLLYPSRYQLNIEDEKDSYQMILTLEM